MKPFLAILITALTVSGNASADDGFRIETETQFENDYSGQVEKVSPGVYLVVNGPSAGNTVSIGRSGLEYDLSIQRARVADAILAGTPDPYAEQRVLELEQALSRYAELDQLLSAEAKRTAPIQGVFTCFGRVYTNNPAGWTTVFYNATAILDADVEFYIDNGGGGWNHYYARAKATAIGHVFRPFNVPVSSGSLYTTTHAKNKRTGVSSSQFDIAYSFGAISTGYVTNFNWTHSLLAEATATGRGDCFGYASVSDTEPTY